MSSGVLKGAVVGGDLRFDNREFKKLRRQLQGKRHLKIELYVKSFAIISC